MKWFLWSGRAVAGVLFLFWGAFFVEHLQEWFLRAEGRYPPPFVWFTMLFHLAMLVGLLLVMRWDRVGSVVLLAGTAGFFGLIAHSGGWKALPYGLLNLAPVLLFAAFWALSRRLQPGLGR